MQSKKLPNIYWAKAIGITIYILNQSPKRSLHSITPYEAWFERKNKFGALESVWVSCICAHK